MELDGLDAIDWSGVDHAYGPATDVPDRLRSIAGPDEAARERALWELSGSIHHQGTIYPATALAVPFLARIAVETAMPPGDRTMIVALLGAIAAGASTIQLRDESRDASATNEIDPAVARQLEAAIASRAAVGREAPALIAGLGGLDPQTDWRLAALAAQVPESAAAIVPIVGTLQRRSDDPRLQAALALTVGLVRGHLSRVDFDAAVAAIGPEEFAEADVPAGPESDGRARLVAANLYEIAFDETHVGG